MKRFLLIVTVVMLLFGGGVFVQVVDGGEVKTPLLEYLEATGAAEDDLLVIQKQIARLRGQLLNGSLDFETRRNAADDASILYFRLVSENSNHELCPLWQTDYAELLIETLDTLYENAPAFVDMGFATAEQSHQLARLAPLAYEQAASAEMRFFQLQSQLPRQADHVEKRVNTGLWLLMIDKYWQRKTRYFLAVAAYYTSRASDSGVYYQTLGENPNVASHLQKKTIEQERRRLLLVTINQLKPLIENRDDATIPYDLQLQALTYTGRAQMALNRFDPAMKNLKVVVDAGKEDRLYDLMARITMVELFQKRRQDSAARRYLKAVRNHALAGKQLLFRLLAADVEFKYLIAEANHLPEDRRPLAMSDACRVYLDLLDDLSATAIRQTLAGYIGQRLADHLASFDSLDQLPSEMLDVVVQTLRIEGQRLVADDMQTGRQKLEQAIEYSNHLLDKDDLPESIMANARYNRALAGYFLSDRNLAITLDIAGEMVDIGQRYPQQPVAESALRDALAMYEPLVLGQSPPEKVMSGYMHAVEQVLFKQYATTQLADDYRLFYVQAVVMAYGQYHKASPILRSMPVDDPNFFAAQQLLIECHFRQFESADEQRKKQLVQLILLDAERIEQQALVALRNDVSDQEASIHNATSINQTIAYARLLRGEMLAFDQSLLEASEVFQSVASQPGQDPELVVWAVDRQVDCLAKLKRYHDATDVMSKYFPEYRDGLVGRAEALFTDMLGQVNLLEEQSHVAGDFESRKTAGQEMVILAKEAMAVAGLLHDWIKEQDVDVEQSLYLRIDIGRAYRLAGQPGVALEMLKPLGDQYPANAHLIHELGEAMFAAGQKENLESAIVYYNRLIESLLVDETGKYPGMYWNAWMRRLEICDRLGEMTDTIGERVRQLKYLDPNLGGEPYRSTLIQLDKKYR